MAGTVWTLRTYADVHAALRNDRLAPYGVRVRGDATHRVVREAVAQQLPPNLLNEWRAVLGAQANAVLVELPLNGIANLVTDFAEPWARAAAQLVLGLPVAVVEASMPLARTIFEESAVAQNGAPSDALSLAATRLAGQLAAFGCAGTVQSFVALTHTVPALVSSAMLALLQHPEQLSWLRAHENEHTLAAATDELLRFAGPSRAVFRTALAPVEFGDVAIDAGDEVVLLLAQANRDPARFTDPDALDVQRSGLAHVALGAGMHGCVGASLVRMLLQEALAAFVRAPREFVLDERTGGDFAWIDGSALRAPRDVPCVVRDATATST